jgi:hypothetical protein
MRRAERAPGAAREESCFPPAAWHLRVVVPKRTRKSRTPTALEARVAALEERVTRLEKGEAPPGDGRAAVIRRPRPVKRCPGCGLPLKRRKGRCAACGRPVASL